MPCECDDKDSRNYSRYYDSPDGCDIPTKVLVTTRYGVLAGTVLATYDIMMYSHATTLGSMISRYLVHTVPLGLMGATFAVVANGLCQYRQRDDGWNYFFGGVACAPILASYIGSKHALLHGGLILGLIGAIKKDCVDNGYTIIPVDKVHSHMGSVWGPKNDFTLSADPKEEMIHTCGSG